MRYVVVTLVLMTLIEAGLACGSQLQSAKYEATTTNGRLFSNTYTIANINITYIDDDGDLYSEASDSGKYGEGFTGSARGVAVYIRADGPGGENDHTGCTWPLLSTAPNKTLPEEPWIAVIKRGSCKFEVKVQNAWRANATAVLIYNDRDTRVVEKMKLSSDNGRNISAVFTYKWIGEQIAQLTDKTRVMVALIPGRTFAHINNN